MAGKLWFMKLYFAIGVPMLIIGLALFGATLYMRSRAKSNVKLMSRRGSNTAYSLIDLNDHIYIKRGSLNMDIGINGRVRKAKISILQAKRELKDMEKAQFVYNTLIVEENLHTHRIVGNKIIYSDRVIKEFPNLHKHLMKLHAINNKLHYYWDELDIYDNLGILTPNRENYLDNRRLIFNDVNQLISNSYEFNMFLKSKINLSNQFPIIDENLASHLGRVDKSTGKRIIPTIAEYHAYLDVHMIRLRKKKFKLEKDLKKRRETKEFYEAMRLI